MIKNILRLALGLAASFSFLASAHAAQLAVHDANGCSSSADAGVSNYVEFSNWLGQKPQRVVDFLFMDTWADTVRSSALLAACWQAAGVTDLTVSVPMLASDGTSTLAAGAAGAYDAYFTQIARNLIAHGYPNAVVRLGWEFNIANWPWAAANDPGNFVLFWKRIVDLMRAVPGQAFQFEWAAALWCNYGSAGTIAPPAVYPGEGYVDLIGLDVYNEFWGSAPKNRLQRWQAILNQPYGLQWQRRFALVHAKPMSYPEWGTGTRPDGHGGGDDGFFVGRMAAWIANHRVAYQAYFDENTANYDAKISDGAQPRAAAAYLNAYR